MNILNETFFGCYELEVALILRKSLFLNGILTNSEAWYGLSVADMKILEQIDESLLRKFLQTPVSTPKCILYLETGSTPIRFIIISRRLMFLHYILRENEESLISKFFQAQLANPVKNDWTMTCSENLQELGIDQSLNEIRSMSKQKFKTLIKEKNSQKAFAFLQEEKSKLSKVKDLQYEKLMIQTYLLPSNLADVRLAKFVFSLRSRMLDVKCNYKNNYSNLCCPICKNENDDQEHLLSCEGLRNLFPVNKLPNYDDLYGNNHEEVLGIARILKQQYETRKSVLKDILPQ